MLPHAISLRLPDWIHARLDGDERLYENDEARMRLAIELSRWNVREKTGGPFGAAIFEGSSGRLISVGVNLVETSRCSVAHAEMMAIMLGQQSAAHFSLRHVFRGAELFTSSEPCAMCLGAIPWAGLTRVVCAARDSDVRGEAGFEEGQKPENWVEGLEQRGIAVRRDLMREAAREVLREYADKDGLIYNPNQEE